jgi:hypothetical protein
MNAKNQSGEEKTFIKSNASVFTKSKQRKEEYEESRLDESILNESVAIYPDKPA